MLAYKELDDVLKLTIKWEEELKDLYDVALYGIRDTKSKELISFLHKKQTSNLEILEKLDIRDYGPVEWLKFAADYHIEDLIPAHDLTKDSRAEDIFQKINLYESKLKDFYIEIADLLVSERQQELFTSLSVFKNSQIEALSNFMKHHFE